MKTTIVSDELLAKFLDNKTTEEETEIVLKYINEDKKNLEEFLHIRKASLLVDQKPCQSIENQTIPEQSEREIGSKNKILKNKKRTLWFSIAASILFIISISLFFILNNTTTQPDEMVQNNQKDAIKKPKKIEQTIDSQKENQNTSIHPEEQKSTESQDNPKSATDEVPVQIKTQNYADQQIAENKWIMLKPLKSPYSILCKNLDKQLVFEWEIMNAKKIEIVLLNSSRKEMVRYSDPKMKSYAIHYRDLNTEKIIIWELHVVFEDNSIQTKSGVIQITYQ